MGYFNSKIVAADGVATWNRLPYWWSLGCYIAIYKLTSGWKSSSIQLHTYIAISGKDDTQIVLITKYIVGFLVTRLPLWLTNHLGTRRSESWIGQNRSTCMRFVVHSAHSHHSVGQYTIYPEFLLKENADHSYSSILVQVNSHCKSSSTSHFGNASKIKRLKVYSYNWIVDIINKKMDHSQSLMRRNYYYCCYCYWRSPSTWVWASCASPSHQRLQSRSVQRKPTKW